MREDRKIEMSSIIKVPQMVPFDMLVWHLLRSLKAIDLVLTPSWAILVMTEGSLTRMKAKCSWSSRGPRPSPFNAAFFSLYNNKS